MTNKTYSCTVAANVACESESLSLQLLTKDLSFGGWRYLVSLDNFRDFLKDVRCLLSKLKEFPYRVGCFSS